MSEWYFPITILPAIGFFIVASSSISNSLSAEISRMIEIERGTQTNIIRKKVQQLRLVNLSLICLYLSGVTVALASLLAGLSGNMVLEVHELVFIAVCLGIGFIILALLLQSIFSVRAFRIKSQQLTNKIEQLHHKKEQHEKMQLEKEQKVILK